MLSSPSTDRHLGLVTAFHLPFLHDFVIKFHYSSEFQLYQPFLGPQVQPINSKLP